MALYVTKDDAWPDELRGVRKATDAEIAASARSLDGVEVLEWCVKHRLPRADGIEDVCAIAYMPLFDPDEDLPCRITSKLLSVYPKEAENGGEGE